MSGVDFRIIWNGFIRILVASLLMGMVLWVFLALYDLDLAHATVTQKLSLIGMLLGLAGATYFAGAKLFIISELSQIISLLTKRK